MHYLSAADLNRIEQALGVVLPDHYRAFHLTQQELIRQLRESTGEPAEDWLHLATDAVWLIETNQLMKLPKQQGPVRGKLCIGGDGGGGFYFIRVDDPTDPIVYTLPHDEEEEVFDDQLDDYSWSFEGLTAGLDMIDFAQDILRMYAEIHGRHQAE